LHYLRDNNGELRGLLTWQNRHARLVFLDFVDKPPLAVIVSDGTRRVILRGQDVRTEVRVTGNQVELAVSSRQECRDVEIYVARDSDESLALLSWPKVGVVRLE
jgi:hypothetical protein